jgi:hypothetical protein
MSLSLLPWPVSFFIGLTFTIPPRGTHADSGSADCDPWLAASLASRFTLLMRLVQLEAGDEVAQAIQLSIEYDPQPPLDAGSPQKAPEQIVALVRATAGTA